MSTTNTTSIHLLKKYKASGLGRPDDERKAISNGPRKAVIMSRTMHIKSQLPRHSAFGLKTHVPTGYATPCALRCTAAFEFFFSGPTLAPRPLLLFVGIWSQAVPHTKQQPRRIRLPTTFEGKLSCAAYHDSGLVQKPNLDILASYASKLHRNAGQRRRPGARTNCVRRGGIILAAAVFFWKYLDLSIKFGKI